MGETTIDNSLYHLTPNTFICAADQDENHQFQMNLVRLCFQVFVRTTAEPDRHIPLPPIVSQPVIDKRTSHTLMIHRLSHASGSARGGLRVILLCDRIKKEEIGIEFYELRSDGQTAWSAMAEFTESDVHRMVAISFRTPAYRNPDTMENVMVWVRLFNQKTNTYSVGRRFEYCADPSAGINWTVFIYGRRPLKSVHVLMMFHIFINSRC